jgi:hypothetical protein
VTQNSNAKKTPGQGGRLKAAAAPKPALRTLSECELLKVRGADFPTKRVE